jgi:tRNA nucleotidyltransferase/poly(A) polymerase
MLTLNERQPTCLVNPEWSVVFNVIYDFLQDYAYEAFVYGGANYKTDPNDLDLIVFGLSNEAQEEFIESMQLYFSVVEKYEKKTGYRSKIIKTTLFDKQIDWSLSPSQETIFSHAEQIDFTIGACYFDIRKGVTLYPFVESSKHIQTSLLATFVPSQDLMKKDASVIFRMIRILAKYPNFSLDASLGEGLKILLSNAEKNIFMDDQSIKPNRLHLEIELCWSSGYAYRCLLLLEEYNLLDKIFPEITINSAEEPSLALEKKIFITKLMQAVCQIQDSSMQKYSSAMLYHAVNWFTLNHSLDLDSADIDTNLRSFYYDKYRRTTVIWHPKQKFFFEIIPAIKATREIASSLSLTTEPKELAVNAISMTENNIASAPIAEKIVSIDQEKHSPLAKVCHDSELKKIFNLFNSDTISTQKCEAEAVNKESNQLPSWLKKKSKRAAYRKRLQQRKQEHPILEKDECDYPIFTETNNFDEEPATLSDLTTESSSVNSAESIQDENNISCTVLASNLSTAKKQRKIPPIYIPSLEDRLTNKYQEIEHAQSNAEFYDVAIFDGSPQLEKIPDSLSVGHVIALDDPTDPDKPYQVYYFERSHTNHPLIPMRVRISNLEQLKFIKDLEKIPMIAQISVTEMSGILKDTSKGELTPNPKLRIVEKLCSELIDQLNATRNNPKAFNKLTLANRATIKFYLAKAYCLRGATRYNLSNEDSASCEEDYKLSLEVDPWMPDVYIQHWKKAINSMKSALQSIGSHRKNYNSFFDFYECNKTTADNLCIEIKECDPEHPYLEQGLSEIKNIHNTYELLLASKFSWRQECLALLKAAAQHEIHNENAKAIASYQQLLEIQVPQEFQTTLAHFQATAHQKLFAVLFREIAQLAIQNKPENISRINLYYQQLVTYMDDYRRGHTTQIGLQSNFPVLYLRWGNLCASHGDHENAVKHYLEAALEYQRKTVRDFQKVALCYELISKIPVLSEIDQKKYEAKRDIALKMLTVTTSSKPHEVSIFKYHQQPTVQSNISELSTTTMSSPPRQG